MANEINGQLERDLELLEQSGAYVASVVAGVGRSMDDDFDFSSPVPEGAPRLILLSHLPKGSPPILWYTATLAWKDKEKGPICGASSTGPTIQAAIHDVVQSARRYLKPHVPIEVGACYLNPQDREVVRAIDSEGSWKGWCTVLVAVRAYAPEGTRVCRDLRGWKRVPDPTPAIVDSTDRSPP